MLALSAALVAAFGLFVLAGATPAALGLLADVSERFPTDRGAIMGLYSVFLAIGQIIGAVIGGAAADIGGIDAMFVATLALLLVALIPLAQLRRDEHYRDGHRRRRGVRRRSGLRRPAERVRYCRSAGGRLRSHDAATGPSLTTAEARVTSNVGQNYPYTSETEADRATSVKRARRGPCRPRRDAGQRDDTARRQRALVGLEVPDARAAAGSSTWRATRPRSTRSSSCATGNARRRSCADRRAGRRRPATPTASPEESRRRLIVEALGIAASAIGFGFVYGLSAREAGFSPLEAMAMSTIVFAGAAQFAAIGYVAAGLAWPAIALLTFLLNARHLLYSAALGPWMTDVPRPRRALMAHVLTDEAFALAIGHFRRIGRTDEGGYWIGAIASTFIPWNLATLAGVYAGGSIADPGRPRHRHHLSGRDDRAGRRAHHGPAGAGRGVRRRRDRGELGAVREPGVRGRAVNRCHRRRRRRSAGRAAHPGLAGGRARPARNDGVRGALRDAGNPRIDDDAEGLP